MLHNVMWRHGTVSTRHWGRRSVPVENICVTSLALTVDSAIASPSNIGTVYIYYIYKLCFEKGGPTRAAL